MRNPIKQPALFQVPTLSQPMGRAQGARITRHKTPLFMVTLVPDDSASIMGYGNAPAIRRGHNKQLDFYRDTGRTDFLIRTRYLNGFELFDFCRPQDLSIIHI